jgi:hypothetical protein
MFQKKKKEIEIKELTEKDIQNLKKKLTDKQSDPENLEVKDLNISEIIPQVYNDVIISILDGYHTLYLPNNMEKGKFRTWRKSAGGMFSKDVLNYSREKDHGKYVLIEGKGERKIVRLIEDEELSLFSHLKLVKGILKDKPYMILKNLAENENLTSSVRYIKENSEHEEVEETITVAPQATASDDDEYDSNTSSVSLFDE